MASRLHVCVGALLVRGDTVLLGRRSNDREWLADAWDVIGGHIRPGEGIAAALLREVEEEVGIVPTAYAFLETIGGDHPEPWRLHLHAVTAWHGEPHNRQVQEHAELRWCTLEQAQALLRPAHPDFARVLARAMGGNV